MSETTKEFGAPPADPFDPDEPSQAEQDAEAGGPDPPAEESGAEDSTPLPPTPEEEPRAAVRDEEEKAPNPNAGMRIVFAARGELGPFQPIPEERVEGDDTPPGPMLFAGDDKQARLDALEQHEKLAEAAKAGELWLATVPASSWKPRKAAPRPRKSDWAV